MSKKIKFIDLFCGLGGFRIALEKQNCKCVFSSDIDEAVSKVYENNFGDYPSGDITKIDAKDIPEFDILCGGFPCQSFSIAGKRLGFEDTRGTMFFEVARILREKKPKAFILENVKGLTNHDKGKTLNTILDILNELGYDFVYKVLNSSDFGIPQSRERWYCVGVRKDLKINLNENDIFPPEQMLLYSYDDIIDDKKKYDSYKISDICKKNIQTYIDKVKDRKSKYTLAYEIRPSRCQFRANGISPCLTAKMGTGGNNVPVVVELNRKLTERECLKLMGYPDTYKIGTGAQAYKQIGNSVIVPILEYISKQLVELLKKGEAIQ
ncbi:MAG: DNA (cytosine-5-)-methyltransferase [Clostridia bacterium]|nr:DNA (cytosine-5-)-methyltransferase [Clostridia bacterium]